MSTTSGNVPTSVQINGTGCSRLPYNERLRASRSSNIDAAIATAIAIAVSSTITRTVTSIAASPVTNTAASTTVTSPSTASVAGTIDTIDAGSQ
ncbi:hypothetical protein K440DRAFT_621336 [Wilcoxina mikolae CBS 423.85]|nr:hypothetical protein K440DRAFT_621336 [Wilcoxina mikolae CBS 423.85]